MQHSVPALLAELRLLLAELGSAGGLISPSLYDTAQVARLAPPPEGPCPALDWLLTQQRPDGGWGEPSLPYARAVPTLAAVLALHARGEHGQHREAAREATVYLRREAAIWSEALPNDLPVGVELLLPRLLDEARAAGFELPMEPYSALLALGVRRRRLLAGLRLEPGTTPVHSWEALGLAPDPHLFDAAGGIGHSPAATAAWLHATASRDEYAAARARAYLDGAARATGSGIPGVVPTAWPIARFERSFGVFALNLAGLFRHQALADLVAGLAAETAASLRPRGYSFSDAFEPNGDDTAAGMTVAHLAGYSVSPATLRAYERDGHFCTFPRELQVSFSALARAAYMLNLLGEDTGAYVEDLLAARGGDGRWTGDKWNGAWLYTTCHAVHAIAGLPGAAALLAPTLTSILAHQRPDGGWGSAGGSNTTETAYGVLALRGLAAIDRFRAAARAALAGARRFMGASRGEPGSSHCWIGKEIYRPVRVDRAFELSAALALATMED